MMFQSDSIKQTLPRPAGNRACIDFSQDALFGIFGPQKAQIGRLEKIWHKKLTGFFPGPARNRTTAHFLKTLYLDFLAPKKLRLDVLRKSNKLNLQDFSQDPPGIEPPHVFSRRSIWNFGPQKAQIGRLEKIQQKKLAGFFPGPARNRTTARFLKTLYLEFLAPKKLKLDVLRKSNKRNLQDFSQDSPGIEPPHVFSRRSIWNFWPPKSSNWTS